MSPFLQARAVYEKEPCKRYFEEDLSLHFRYGFVFSTPQFFIMGRPINSKATHESILDPSHVFPRQLQDCWLVWLLAGDISKAWSILPYPLPLLAFERKNDLRFVKAEDIQRFSLSA